MLSQHVCPMLTVSNRVFLCISCWLFQADYLNLVVSRWQPQAESSYWSCKYTRSWHVGVTNSDCLHFWSQSHMSNCWHSYVSYTNCLKLTVRIWHILPFQWRVYFSNPIHIVDNKTNIWVSPVFVTCNDIDNNLFIILTSIHSKYTFFGMLIHSRHYSAPLDVLFTYLTTYSPWSAMHELSLLLNYQVFRWNGTSSFLQL